MLITMNKMIDIDSYFEKYLREYIKKNTGKYTEEEWESKIPELYEEFSNTPLEVLDNKTPNTYFLGVDGVTLVNLLVSYLQSNISVPDYLCEAIISSTDSEKSLISLLNTDNDEVLMYALNLLSDMDSVLCLNHLVEFILDGGTSVGVKDVSAEMLARHPEKVKDKLVSLYNDSGEEEKEYFTDILSRCQKDDRVFEILVDAFASHTDNYAYYSSLLARYGDERALPLLYEAIETNVDYAEFSEIKFAIETLGGEYLQQRDFSKDKIYKKIVNNK